MRSCEVVAGATLPAVRRFFRVPRDRRHHATGEIVNPWPVVGIEVFFVLGTFGLAASVASATNLYTAVATALVGYLVGIAISWSLARLVRRRVERSIKPRGWEYAVEAVGPWLIPMAGVVGMWLGGLTDGVQWGDVGGLAGVACVAGFLRAFMFMDFQQPTAHDTSA